MKKHFIIKGKEMKDKLTKIVGNLNSDDMKYILNELGKESTANYREIETQVVELTQDDLSIVKLTLTTLIKDDDEFAQKFQTIVDGYEPNRAFDPVTVGIALGILALTTIANNLIKAKYPNRVITKNGDKSKEIDRGYSNLSDALKPLASLFAGDDTNE